MAACITGNGVKFNESMLRQQMGDAGLKSFMKKHLMTYTNPQVVATKQLAVYMRTGSTIMCPRGYISRYTQLQLMAGATSSIMAPTQSNSAMPDAIMLSGNQTAVLDWIMEHRFTPMQAAAGTALVNLKMKAGEGKSILGLALHRALHLETANTLIIVPTEYLQTQWTEEIDKFYTSDVPTVGMYAGGAKKRPGRITIGIINSLIKAPLEYFTQFGFVIYDESHDYCTSQFSRIFWMCGAAYQLSLTATPDERKDGFDRALVFHFNNIVDAATLPGYARDEVRFEGDVTVIEYYGPPEYTRTIVCESTGIVSVPLMLQCMQADPYRAAYITSSLQSSREAGRHVMLFSETRNYTDILRSNLLAMATIAVCGDDDVATVAAAENIHVLKGGTKKPFIELAKSAAQTYSIILNTYSYSRRGISIQQMDTLWLSSPRASGMTQIIARILRKGSDATIRRQVFDLVDMGTPMKNQLRSRMKTYMALQFTVKKITVKWQDISLPILAIPSAAP